MYWYKSMQSCSYSTFTDALVNRKYDTKIDVEQKMWCQIEYRTQGCETKTGSGESGQQIVLGFETSYTEDFGGKRLKKWVNMEF